MHTCHSTHCVGSDTWKLNYHLPTATLKSTILYIIGILPFGNKLNKFRDVIPLFWALKSYSEAGLTILKPVSYACPPMLEQGPSKLGGGLEPMEPICDHAPVTDNSTLHVEEVVPSYKLITQWENPKIEFFALVLTILISTEFDAIALPFCKVPLRWIWDSVLFPAFCLIALSLFEAFQPFETWN